MISATNTKTIIEERLELNATDILEMLGKAFPERFKNVSEIKAFVPVPGGGDWSNTNLDVGLDAPLIITTKTISEQ